HVVRGGRNRSSCASGEAPEGHGAHPGRPRPAGPALPPWSRSSLDGLYRPIIHTPGWSTGVPVADQFLGSTAALGTMPPAATTARGPVYPLRIVSGIGGGSRTGDCGRPERSVNRVRPASIPSR